MQPADDTDLATQAELARAAGTTPRSVRYCREIGLLRPEWFVRRGRYLKLRRRYFEQAKGVLECTIHPQWWRE
jgi:DNA-binding transcriptional MerR regulator